MTPTTLSRKIITLSATALLICALLSGPRSIEAQSTPVIGTGFTFQGVGAAIIGCSNVSETLNDPINELASSAEEGFATITSELGVSGSVETHDKELGTKLQKTEKAIQVIKKDENAKKKRDECLNGIAYATAKSILADVTKKTINWASTGFGGNPFYVRDQQTFLNGIASQQVSQIIADIQNKTPYSNSISQSIVRQNTQSFANNFKYNLDTIIGHPYDENASFADNGGWTGFLAHTTRSANNPVGAQLETQRELAERTQTAQDNANRELAQNNGFLSEKKCVTRTGGPVVTGSTGNACDHYEVQTPGIIIEQQLSQVLGTPIRQLELADTINESLGSVFDSLLNTLYNKGLNALGSAIATQSGTDYSMVGTAYGNNSSITTGGTGNSSSVITGSFSGNGTYNGLPSVNSGNSWFASNQDFNIKRRGDLDQVIKVQEAYLANVQKSQPPLDKIVPAIAYLDYCIPGPNPAWTDEANASVQEAIYAFQNANWNGGSPEFKTLSQRYTDIKAIMDAYINFAGGGYITSSMVDTVATAIVHLFGGKTIQERIDEDNLDAAAAAVQAEQDFYTAMRQAALDLQTNFVRYRSAVIDRYAPKNNLPVAADAYELIKNLRNYDANITQAKSDYQDEIDRTNLNIYRLKQIQKRVNVILANAERRQRLSSGACATAAPQGGLTATGLSGTSTSGVNITGSTVHGGTIFSLPGSTGGLGTGAQQNGLPAGL